MYTVPTSNVMFNKIMSKELSLLLTQRLVTKARLIHDPFPYIWIQNFFPEELYAQIQNEVKTFDPRGKKNYEKPESGVELYDPPSSQLFKDIKYALADSPFSEAMFAYFKTEPFKRFDVTLNRDLHVKYMGPLLDSNPPKLSFHIYLPSDASQQDQGTILGRKEKGVFTPVTQLSFLPNCGYAFLTGERSWHSAPVFSNPIDKPRYSLLYRWKKTVE